MKSTLKSIFGARRWVRWLFVGVLAIGVSGCAQHYRVQVDALRDAEAPAMVGEGQTYVIDRARAGRGAQDLRFQEAARMVEATLDSLGYRRVSDRDEADLVIMVEARMSNPLASTETRAEPVFYRTMGYTRVVRTPVFDSSGNVVSYRSTRVYYPPHSEFLGYSERDRHVTLYDKYLHLSAWTLEAGEPESEVWTVTVVARDQSSDLRGYLPILLAGAYPYIGESTDGQVVVSIRRDAERIQSIREAR